jgi:hypothetical protein
VATHDDQADEFLRPRFADLRDDTMNRLRPAGALAARRAYDSRRTSRIITVAIATSATIILAAVGGTAALHRPHQPLPVTVSPSPHTATPSDSPSPPGTPPPSTGSATSGSVAGPPVPHDATTPRCHTRDLSLKYLGGDGGSGRGNLFYSLSNGSGHDCSLSGTPQLRAVDAKGKTLLTAEEEAGTGQKIVLHPGGAAYTSTTIGNIPSDDANRAPCNPPAAALWLIPPGETAHLTIDGPWHICSNGELSISPFDPVRPAAAHS